MKQILVKKIKFLVISVLIISNSAYSQAYIKKNNYDSIFNYNRNMNDSTFDGEHCINDSICISYGCEFLINYYGISNIKLNIKANKEDSIISRIFFKTNNSKEYLKVVKTPINSYCTYFEIGYVRSQGKKKYLLLPFKTLITDYDIKLGMDEKKFLSTKGKEYNEKKKTGNSITYVYKWDTGGSQYGDTYLCFYQFRESKLIRFGFGISDKIWN